MMSKHVTDVLTYFFPALLTCLGEQFEARQLIGDDSYMHRAMASIVPM